MRLSRGGTRGTPWWRLPLTRLSSPPYPPQHMGLGPPRALRPRSVALRTAFSAVVNYHCLDRATNFARSSRELRAILCKGANKSADHCPEVYANFARTMREFVQYLC